MRREKRGGEARIPLRKKYIYIFLRDKCFGFRNGMAFSFLGGPRVIGIKFHNVGRESCEEGAWMEWRAKDKGERKGHPTTKASKRSGTDERTQQGIPSCLRSDTPGLPMKEEKRVPPFHHE